MGQQQILLIILSVILIGISISVVNSLYRSQVDKSEMDNLTNVLNNVGICAYKYYVRPAVISGAQKEWQLVVDNEELWMPDFTVDVFNEEGLQVEMGGPGLLISGKTPSKERNGIIAIDNQGLQQIRWTDSWE